MATLTDTLTDSVTLTEGVTETHVDNTFELEDGVVFTETTAQAITWHTTVTDAILLSIKMLKAYDSVSVSDGIVIGQTDAWYLYYTRKIRERLEISFDQATKMTYAPVETDGVLIEDEDGLVRGTTASLTEAITIALAQTVVQNILVLEALGITDQIIYPFKYAKSLTEEIELADSVARFLGATITEVMAIVETVSRMKRIQPIVTEDIEISEALTRTLLLQVVANDEIEIGASEVLKMFFKPVLTESIDITGAYVDRDGMTTWAVNLSHGGVTEYTNYKFNSFAQLGNKYLAANDTGLYELLGDDDDGTDIIARMKSGLLQIGQSKFTSFKGIYLGLRGGGDYVLKLVTGDDKTFVYSVEAKSMETTRVRHGKGLRARYFSYELISTGQDFDLDSIEFIPLVAQRRV